MPWTTEVIAESGRDVIFVTATWSNGVFKYCRHAHLLDFEVEVFIEEAKVALSNFTFNGPRSMGQEIENGLNE